MGHLRYLARRGRRRAAGPALALLLCVHPAPGAAQDPIDASPLPIGVRVDASALNVRSAPSSAAPAIASLSRSTLVVMVERRGAWARVGFVERGVLDYGWVATRYLRAAGSGKTGVAGAVR